MIKDLAGKKVTVFGLGISGEAAARKLTALGCRVLVSEEKTRDAFSRIEELASAGVEFEFGGHTDRAISGADLIVMSPGIHLDLPVLEKARQKGIPVVSEVEAASWFIRTPVIAITGTNGKTTTTMLLGEMLRAGGKRIALAGNLGNPLITVDDTNLDFVVTEISSYQLETAVDFRPRISIILNLSEDHLERHRTMEEYRGAKIKIFQNQGAGDTLILNYDDLRTRELQKLAPCRVVPFSRKVPLDGGIFLANDFISFKLTAGPRGKIIKRKEIAIPGEHNLENALAATGAALTAGISPDAIARSLRDFKGVPHRIEFVEEIRGVNFFNDSKATNPDSTIVALKTLVGKQKNIVLIAGGRDKGGHLDDLVSFIKGTTKQVVLLGEAAPRFKRALMDAGFNRVAEANSLKAAVEQAFTRSSRGDTVLLSPACASFDMFANFEERGACFKALVKGLREQDQ